MRVALIGLGYMGSKYVSELLELQEEGLLEFTGVADVSPTRLEELTKHGWQLAELRQETDHMKLLDLADAAIIATPNEMHYEIARHWLEAGKHVLVEKPVCTSSVDAQGLLNMAVDRSLFIMPGHLYRFSKLLKEVRKVIDSDALGKVEEVNMRWITPSVPNPMNHSASADVRLDLLPHCFDIVQMLFGRLPQPEGFLQKSVTHAFLYLYDPETRVQFTVEIGWRLPEKYRSIEIVGAEKWLSTDVVKSFQFYYLTTPLNTGKREEVWVVPNNTLQDQVRGFLRGIVKTPKDYSLMEAAVEGLKLIEQTMDAVR